MLLRESPRFARLRTLRDGEHHETIPHHSPLKAGTLNVVLRNLAVHHRMDRDELLELLDL